MIIKLLLTVAALANPSADSRALFKTWEKLTTPAAGAPEAIGSYSAGCLVGAEKLPLDGTGYSVMRVSRARYYGHPTLLSYLKELGAAVESAGLHRILVGDMGRARGGPMLSGHASHQVGLDVDLWYQMPRKKPGRKERETWGATRLVDKNGRVTKGWGEEQRKLLALAAARPEVERVFVHAGIKKDLCQKSPDAPWLAKLRPWWGHDDHLHVRLKCPAGNRHCEAQVATAEIGTQCGAELDWWFSQEAKDELKKKPSSREREFPTLPAACAALTDSAGATQARKSP